jgi:hypothetical protein
LRLLANVDQFRSGRLAQHKAICGYRLIEHRFGDTDL